MSIGSKQENYNQSLSCNHFRDYLLNPCSNEFSFEKVDESEVIKIIDTLKSTVSCGYDGINTRLLKIIKKEICKPITLIINRSISTGIFPNKFKLARVISVYKKENKTRINYFNFASKIQNF